MMEIKLPRLTDLEYVSPEFIDFRKWMLINIGKYGTEWKWVSLDTYDLSVYVKDPAKATFMILKFASNNS
jgi:hypothetical protein